MSEYKDYEDNISTIDFVLSRSIIITGAIGILRLSYIIIYYIMTGESS
jgi:hypothetical protein